MSKRTNKAKSKKPRFSLRTHLRGQKDAFLAAFKTGWHNTEEVSDDFGLSLAHSINRGIRRAAHIVTWPVTAPVRGVRALLRKAKRGLAKVAAGFAALLKQLGHDLVRAAGAPFRGAGNFGREMEQDTKVVGRQLKKAGVKVAKPLIFPVRKIFAQRAKAELAGVPMTTDQKSHKELFILVGVSLLAVLAVAASVAGLLPGTGGSISLNPGRIMAKVSAFSPEQMVILAGFGLAFVIGTWFWANMVRDAFRRDFPTQTEQTKWRVITTLLFIPGALAYFRAVYNHWSLKQFLGYHFVSLVVIGVVTVVMSSTYGTLWYFNNKASATAAASSVYKQPNLDLDERTKDNLLSRGKYGAPLTPSTSGGRIDPFAPVPGLTPTDPTTALAASPSPSPSPTPAVNR